MKINITLAKERQISVYLGRTVINTGNGEIYDGEYSVTPKVYEETELETKHKLMKDDVVVRKIPTFEVSNESGGTTLIIGEEIYG